MVSLSVVAGCVALCAQLAVPTTALDSAAGRQLAERGIREFREYVSHANRTSGSINTDYYPTRAEILRRISMLAAQLDRAGEAAPRDQWVMAMRVSWKVAIGNYEGGERVATAGCTEPLWWCTALRGYAQRYAFDFVAAERTFDLALSQMSPEQRCMWNDLSLVLSDRALIESYSVLDCAAQAELNTRIWWLADPLWADDWNDRRIEHYVRWVTAELLQREAEVLGWAEFRLERDNRNLHHLLRYGGLVWCGRMNHGIPNQWGIIDCPSEAPVLAVGPHSYRLDLAQLYHGSPRGYVRSMRFLPRLAAINGGFRTLVLEDALEPRKLQDDVTVRNQRGASVRYYDAGDEHYPYFGWMHVITDAQVGMLLREGSANLLAAWSPHVNVRAGDQLDRTWRVYSVDSLKMADLDIALVLSAAPDVPRVISRTTHAAGDSVLRMTVPTTLDSALISLEMLSVKHPVGARHRFAVHRPSAGARTRVTTSDIILHTPNRDSPPTSEAEVTRLMLPRSTLRRRESVGLYWELYGLRPGESPEFELSVESLDEGGILRAVTAAIGLRSRGGTVAARWKESALAPDRIGEHGESAHTITIDLGSLSRGMHRLTVTTRVDGEEIAISRVVRIE